MFKYIIGGIIVGIIIKFFDNIIKFFKKIYYYKKCQVTFWITKKNLREEYETEWFVKPKFIKKKLIRDRKNNINKRECRKIFYEDLDLSKKYEIISIKPENLHKDEQKYSKYKKYKIFLKPKLKL